MKGAVLARGVGERGAVPMADGTIALVPLRELLDCGYGRKGVMENLGQNGRKSNNHRLKLKRQHRRGASKIRAAVCSVAGVYSAELGCRLSQ
jgi:hypothetical protein